MRRLRDESTEQSVSQLYIMRAQTHPSDYVRLCNAYRQIAKKRQDGLTRKLRSFGELYWLPSAPMISLDSEFAWAAVWLSPVISRINLHVVRLKALHESFNVGDFAAISSAARDSIGLHGWSYWSSSLMLGAAFAADEPAAGPTLAAELQRKGVGRVSGLLARMIADRNDASISWSSFEARCKEYLERVGDAPRRALIKAKALAELDDEEQCSHLLAHEASSSYLDYYESLLQVAAIVMNDDGSENLKSAVQSCFEQLLGRGLDDWRINHIVQPPNLNVPPTSPTLQPQHDILLRCAGMGTTPPAKSNSEWLNTLHVQISSADELGLTANDDLDDLFKIGVNFQSLPVGRAIWSKGIQPYLPVERLPIFIDALTPAPDNCLPYALLAKNDGEIETVLRAASVERAKQVIAVLDSGDLSAVMPVRTDAYNIWLARALIRKGNPIATRALASELKKCGGVWSRYGDKLEILALIESNDLHLAMNACAELISRDARLGYELPMSSLVEGRSWQELKNLSSALVASIAHAVNLVTSSSRSRFICRMACRDLYKHMHGAGIEAFINDQNDSDKKILCDFLRIGWTDENLALVEDLASSQDVRREKLKIFQILLAIDGAHADYYREVIQALTLDETLWSGLREIDSNRVFVNEAAITRWAEKELTPEYERWRSVRAVQDISDLKVDQMLRTYLLGNELDVLLVALPERQQSESGAVMLGILSKLFGRFLSDPANGLNSYLSLRVRHGTLRGVLLGPIEEDRLLLSGEYSESEFNKRWAPLLGLAPGDLADLRSEIAGFSEALDKLARWIVNEKIQIRSSAKPEGMFASTLDPARASELFTLMEPTWSFGFFLNQCYLVFWDSLAPSRTAISNFFLVEMSRRVQDEFQLLMTRLGERFEGFVLQPLLVALQSLSTRAGEACRIIAEWFLPAAAGEEQTYPLNSALEIARKATSNVYRDFHSELEVDGDAGSDIALSTSGLSILYDSLFVIFGNAWVHSGLGSRVGSLRVKFTYDEAPQVLRLRVENRVSKERLFELSSGELQSLKAKYCLDVPLELVPVEGGSGFAKLARIAAAVDRRLFPAPLEFGLTSDDNFFVDLCIQLYKREGVFDAYL